MMDNGEKLHPRSTRDLLKENAKMAGRNIFWMTTDFMKSKGIRKIEGLMFRYIYPLNKKAEKLMNEWPNFRWTKDYPKEDELVWYDITDKKNKMKIDQPAFTYADAKYNKIPNQGVATLEGFFNLRRSD